MKNGPLLIIDNLSVTVADKCVLENFFLSVESGAIHAIMGPNGSGKSSFAYALMGHPQYMITGSIYLDNTDITNLACDKRAQNGLFLAFQHPLEIPGLSVSSFLKEAYSVTKNNTLSVPEFHTLMYHYMTILGIDHSFASRGLHEGFSGGEKKKLEILQLLLLQPKIAVLDEIDSGLDIDALRVVASGIVHARQENPVLSIILITHYQRILQYIIPDYVHIVSQGRMIQSGNATLAHDIERAGYDGFKNA